MKNMTVKTYLETTDAKYIKLGSKNGASFIFCGTPQDAIKYLVDYNPKEYARLCDRYSFYTDEVEHHDERWATLIELKLKKWDKDHTDKSSKESKFETKEDYFDYLKKLEIKDLARCERARANYERRKNTFTDIETREIVETYPSILINIKGYIDDIVIFTGEEPGEYWDLDEFVNGKGEKNKEDL